MPAYVLDAPTLYYRPGNPYLGPDGHDWHDNPLRFAALGWVASRLLCAIDQPWSIKKAAVWWLRYRLREGVGQVVLQAVQSADCL